MRMRDSDVGVEMRSKKRTELILTVRQTHVITRQRTHGSVTSEEGAESARMRTPGEAVVTSHPSTQSIYRIVTEELEVADLLKDASDGLDEQ